ncbi:DNA-binding transcriptional regulator, FadR family [Propionibacterium cyclohexanicum]|uniref:DNA-binding transcriptional regulator, FadR family n=2 Tax=Propionibacterium cyclohexanicum TaxID=64702 RepID=A0A1H9SVT6_9ACTN|nr:DNA-binding transcriptional regulator, FadR family [Propionibacterium cyclohexanicum]
MRAKGMSGFDVALHHIESAIQSGEYVSGMQLPTERELAATLSVGRGAVREAIRVLQAQGIVVSGTGPGNGTRIRVTPGDALARMLRLHLALDSTTVPDLTETRVVLEKAACEDAVNHVPCSALTRAKVLLERMETHIGTEDFNGLDTAFHVALVEASGNHMLTMICTAIRHTLARPIRLAEQQLDDWPTFREGLVREHRAIFDAIERGDGALAGQLAEAHIRHAYDILLPSARAGSAEYLGQRAHLTTPV